MNAKSGPVAAVLAAGVVASVTSAAMLGLCSRVEGKGWFRPLNATSHWRFGEGAARRDDVDVAHTETGYATHLAATWFWAGLFEALVRARRGRGVAGLAVVTAVVAAGVDYGLTPRRFTPGWELALTKRSMAAGYAAMAAGLAAGRRLGTG